MLNFSETRATAEAAAGPSPLALEMLRALRELSRAEARMPNAQGPAEAVILHTTMQQAQAELEATVARFCSGAPSRIS